MRIASWTFAALLVARVAMAEDAPAEPPPAAEPPASQKEEEELREILREGSEKTGEAKEGEAGVKATAGEGEKKKPAAPKTFVKGELGEPMVGAPEIILPYDSFFLELGVRQLAGSETFFATAAIQLNLLFMQDKLKLAFELPVTMKLLDLNSPGDNFSFAPRTEDFDEPSDFMRVIRRVSYGRKEDNLYVNVGRLMKDGQPIMYTLGHGAIMRRYAPNVDVDSKLVGAQFDAYSDYGGFELAASDITLSSPVIGVLGFFKPGALFSDDYRIRSISIGLTYAADFKAPVQLQRGDSHLGGAGSIETDDANNPLLAESTTVSGLGFDGEIKLYKNDNIDVKTYVDFSLLMDSDTSFGDAGNGLTLGALGRFSLGAERSHAFRTRFELRNFSPRYTPNYFNPLYEVQKYQYITGVALSDLPTKHEVIFGQDPDAGRSTGYYFEAAYSLFNAVSLAAGLEGTFGDALEDRIFYLHAELPYLTWLTVFASYFKLNFTDFGNLFAFDDNELISLGARLEVLPILFLNFTGVKAFRYASDLEFGRGGFRNEIDINTTISLGWQFD